MQFKNDIFISLISLLGVLYQMIYNWKQNGWNLRVKFFTMIHLICFESQGKLLKSHGKVREKSGNLGLVFLWQPCIIILLSSFCRRKIQVSHFQLFKNSSNLADAKFHWQLARQINICDNSLWNWMSSTKTDFLKVSQIYATSMHRESSF